MAYFVGISAMEGDSGRGEFAVCTGSWRRHLEYNGVARHVKGVCLHMGEHKCKGPKAEACVVSWSSSHETA